MNKKDIDIANKYLTEAGDEVEATKTPEEESVDDTNDETAGDAEDETKAETPDEEEAPIAGDTPIEVRFGDLKATIQRKIMESLRAALNVAEDDDKSNTIIDQALNNSDLPALVSIKGDDIKNILKIDI